MVLGKYGNRILLSVYFICLSVLSSLLIAWVTKLKTLTGFAELTIVFSIVYLGGFLLVFKLVKRVSMTKAREKEIKAEDEILLQATAFSQSALWIYLNIIPSTAPINFMKWMVPTVAILFYCLRAYAKLKDNKYWRYFSVYILALVFAASLNISLNLAGAQLKGILVIDGVDEMNYLFSSAIALFPIISAFMLRKQIKKRYGVE